MSLFQTSLSCLTLPAFILTVLLGAQSLHAKEPSPKGSSSLTSLVERLKKIDTITGSFVQYSIDQKGTRVQESRGDFKAKRPGLFYWYTSSPLEQAIYSDGESVTVYDPDLEQATVQQVDQRMQQTPAILFSGSTEEIGEQFEVEERVFDDVVTQYLLTPRTEESLFERLRIRFEGQQLVEMRLGDSLGQETTVRFVQTQVNAELSEDDFIPDLPAGTDIIRDIPAVQPAKAP